MKVMLWSINKWLRWTGFRLGVGYPDPPEVGPSWLFLKWFGWSFIGHEPHAGRWKVIDGVWVDTSLPEALQPLLVVGVAGPASPPIVATTPEQVRELFGYPLDPVRQPSPCAHCGGKRDPLTAMQDEAGRKFCGTACLQQAKWDELMRPARPSGTLTRPPRPVSVGYEPTEEVEEP